MLDGLGAGLRETLMRSSVSRSSAAGRLENEFTDSARGGNIGRSMVMVVLAV
jgi:hypothetical protein